MKENYDKCLAYILLSEGGYVNDKHDPGGATDYGITQAVYSAWRLSQGQSVMAVRMITRQEVSSIYKTQYWDSCRCDELPAGIDYCTFDAAVMSGPVRSIKWLQSCVKVSADGHLGLATMAAIKGVNDRVSLIKALCDKRIGFMHALTNWKFFGKGWTSRMATVRARALAM